METLHESWVQNKALTSCKVKDLCDVTNKADDDDDGR